MRDDNLYQLMLRDAADAPTGPARDDLLRGRQRLRRRRLGVVVATAACGVLAAGVTAYGVSETTSTSDAPATRHDDDGNPPTDFLATLDSFPAARDAYLRLREVVFDHTRFAQHGLVPGWTRKPWSYLEGIDTWGFAGPKGYGQYGDGFAYIDGGTAADSWVTNIQWERPWRESSSTGLLRVETYSSEDAEGWASNWMTVCRGDGSAPPHRFATCEERTTADGDTVLVGVDRRPVGLWMRVNWRQPDGTIVGAVFNGPRWPETQDLSLTVDDLMKVATDPRLGVFDHE
jgi:hypothetical protein